MDKFTKLLDRQKDLLLQQTETCLTDKEVRYSGDKEARQSSEKDKSIIRLVLSTMGHFNIASAHHNGTMAGSQHNRTF